MSIFTEDMPAAEAVALAESLSLKDLNLNLRFELLMSVFVYGDPPCGIVKMRSI